MATRWKPVDEHGTLSAEDRKNLPDSAFAFPGKRKEPLTDADHVRNALARFDQTKDVTDAEDSLLKGRTKFVQRLAEYHGQLALL